MRKRTWLVDEFDPLSKMCHLPLHSQDRFLWRTGRRRFETKLFLEFCRNGHEKMYRNVCSTQIIMFIRLFLKKYIQLCNYVGHFAPQADRYHRGWGNPTSFGPDPGDLSTRQEWLWVDLDVVPKSELGRGSTCTDTSSFTWQTFQMSDQNH